MHLWTIETPRIYNEIMQMYKESIKEDMDK